MMVAIVFILVPACGAPEAVEPVRGGELFEVWWT